MDYQDKIFCELIKSVIHSKSEIILDEEVNWAYLVNLAKAHNLLPIFMEGAAKHPSYISRQEYAMELKVSIAIVVAQAKRTNAFLKLYEAFTKEGIYPLIMKGLICRELYGNLCDHRPSGDEDILIRPTEYRKAKAVLAANGYVPEIEGETVAQLERLQEVSFTHLEEKLYIELHLNPMGRENDARSRMSDYFINVLDDYREVEIQGVMVRTMSHQEHLLYLILHAFKHFTGGGFGIRQMLDILLYQKQYEAEIDLQLLLERLKAFKADAFWSDIVHIGNCNFGFDLTTLRQPNCPQELLEDAIQRGTFGNSTQAEISAGRATSFVVEDYLKNKESNAVMMTLGAIFPKKTYLLYQAPYLEKRPWLLPVAWVRRWIRFIKKGQTADGNLAVESMKISQKRLKLMKKYNLV